MAVFNSYQRSLAEGDPIHKIPGTYAEGRVRYALGTIRGGDFVLADGDSVHMFDLPKGAQILMWLYANGPFGTGISVNIGRSPGGGEFGIGLSVASAGSGSFVPNASLQNTPLADKTEVYVTFTGGNPADNQPLHLGCLYAMP